MTDGRFGRLSDAPDSFTLIGARIVDPSEGTEATRDLFVRDGVIVEQAPVGGEVIDAGGLVVAPGFCDLHSHLREPGDSAAETIETGARAAARGGFTTICAMPNTHPAIDRADQVLRVSEAGGDAACRIRVIGAATIGREGSKLADLDGMENAGAIGFSDDGAAVPNEVALEVARRVAALEATLFEHAEDAEITAGGVMREGLVATRLGLPGWPAEAERTIVERDIALADETGARIHLTHLSTAGAIEAVREAKARGVAVTCDVTPHHLAMTDAWVAGSRRFAWEEPVLDDALAYDGSCRVNPPLGPRDDALALLAAVADGTVDAVATDHAPHPPERKLVPFEEAAPGLIGLETALSLGLAAVEAGRLTLSALIAALSTGPARIIGEERGLAIGAVADLVAFDPTDRWRVEAESLASASANTPLLGMELPGVVRLTVAGGRVTYRS